MRLSDGKNVGRLTAINVYPNSEIYISPSYKYIIWQGLNIDSFFIVESPFKDVMLEKENRETFLKKKESNRGSIYIFRKNSEKL